MKMLDLGPFPSSEKHSWSFFLLWHKTHNFQPTLIFHNWAEHISSHMAFFYVFKLSLDLLAVPFDVYRSIKAL